MDNTEIHLSNSDQEKWKGCKRINFYTFLELHIFYITKFSLLIWILLGDFFNLFLPVPRDSFYILFEKNIKNSKFEWNSLNRKYSSRNEFISYYVNKWNVQQWEPRIETWKPIFSICRTVCEIVDSRENFLIIYEC